MAKLVNPIPLWLDAHGALLDGGYIYIGNAGQDPTIPANQLSLFWDKAETIPAAQPLRTLAGVIVNGMNVGQIYFSATDYSTTVQDSNNNLVFYLASAFDLGGTSYQPLASNLTTLASLTLGAMGETLLQAADASTARSDLSLGAASLLAVATANAYRANTASQVLTTDQVWGAAGYVSLIPGATVSLDLSTGINFSLAMGGNYTLANFTNGKEGQTGKIFITQDATGSRTLAYGTAYKSVGGSAPVLSTAANARDLLYYEVLPGGATAAITLAKNVAA